MLTGALVLKGICKRFSGITALDNVDLELRPGEIHGLLGENGAGKSTLMKILDGALLPDGGQIWAGGQPVEFSSPEAARQHGIAMVYQELNLLPHLTVAENILISALPKTRLGTIDWKRLFVLAQEVLSQLGLEVEEADVKRKVNSLSVAQQQIVAIARALSANCRVLILDEPTSALPQRDVDNLFKVMRTLKNRNVSVVFISHRLKEVMEITDRITVLRNGQVVGALETPEAHEEALVQMIAGRSISERYPKIRASVSGCVLELRNLSVKDKLYNVSFGVQRGEILGVVGLLGAGKTELAQTVFGVYGHDPSVVTGDIILDGRAVHLHSPQQAIGLGIGLVPEDRSASGLVLNQSIRFNISLPSLRSISRSGFVNSRVESDIVTRLVSQLGIKCVSSAQLVSNLSGGNQQKVVLAKWLANKAKLIIMDEPTRGIDVGAKVGVYGLMNDLVSQGMAILFLSSEVPEVHGMADRILVLNRGRIVREVGRGEVTEQELQLLVM